MSERARVLAIAAICAGGIAGGVAGCGNPADITPDGTTVDTTAPKIVSTAPTGNVPILGQLTATFDEPLDPATVSATTVHLVTRLDDSFPAVPGSVTYDAATMTISFAPLRPLTYDAIYELQIGAVADPSGNAFAGAAKPFHAAVNAELRSTSFTNNAIEGYVAYTLDANGHQTKSVRYDSAGTNQTWFDDDDHASTHEETEYSPNGLWLAYRRYAIGNDNKWNSNDDPVVLRDEYTYDTEQRLTKFAEFAADQTLRIDDSWTDRNMMASATFDSAGDDMVWNTTDDKGPQWRDLAHDQTGATTRVTTHNTGGDALPQTADDFISASTTFERDATTYVVTRQIVYGDAGMDLMWLTNDDVVANYAVFTTDSHGLMTTRVAYSQKGNDMAWFTNDDVISSRQVVTYDANLLMTNRDSLNGAGTITSYTTFEYDAAGNRTRQRLYLGAGNDGNWHSPDDDLAVEVTYDTTH